MNLRARFEILFAARSWQIDQVPEIIDGVTEIVGHPRRLFRSPSNPPLVGFSEDRPCPQPDSPLCDCEYLDGCTGSCLEPVGIPEDDLSFHVAPPRACPAGKLLGVAMNGAPFFLTCPPGRRFLFAAGSLVAR